jgi:integrase
MTDRSVTEILDRYEKDRLPLLKRRTQMDYTRMLAFLRRDLGSKVAAQLTLADLADFMNVQKGKIQRNKQLAVLSAAFTEAIGWKWLQSNVCKEVTRHVSKRRDRQLTDEEFEHARRLAKPRIRLVMDLALYTGQSQGQILTLRWDQVDKEVIRFRNPKTAKKVLVPITPKIAEPLEACRRLPPGSREYVIITRKGKPYTGEGFRACWQRTMRKWARAGNDVFNFRDIRAKWVRDNPKPPNGHSVQTPLAAQSHGGITVRPRVFSVPKGSPAQDAAAVMMPLASSFNRVYQTIRDACADTGFQCQRADDIWEESTIIQDIFNLIFRAHVVIVDFTGKNENVFYETGIAHALGKHVVPIARNIDDVPFDIKHHRVLKYTDDSDAGLSQLRQSLAARLRFIGE